MDSDISLLKFEDAGDKMVHSGAAVLPICHWRPSESASAETFDLKHWRVRQWRHVFDHNTFMVLIPLRHILDALNTPELMQMRTQMRTAISLKGSCCLMNGFDAHEKQMTREHVVCPFS